MITLFTGKPRSGKTYRVVYTLLKDCVQDKYYIFHDVDGLKHKKFNDPECINTIAGACEKIGIPIEKFFTKAVQEQLCHDVKEKYGRSVLIVVDECYRYFGEKNRDYRDWLAYHGHYGQDVFLIAHGPKHLHSDLIPLIGEEIRSKKGQIFGKFIYVHRDSQASYKIDWLPRKKEVFTAYRSFDLTETKKRSSILIPCLVILIVSLTYWFLHYAKNPFGSKSEVQAANPSSVAPEKKPEMEKVKTDPFSRYSFAGILGRRVLLQEIDGGRLLGAEEIKKGASLIEVNRSGARLYCEGQYYDIPKRPVKAPAREDFPSGAGAHSGQTKDGFKH